MAHNLNVLLQKPRTTVHDITYGSGSLGKWFCWCLAHLLPYIIFIVICDQLSLFFYFLPLYSSFPFHCLSCSKPNGSSALPAVCL